MRNLRNLGHWLSKGPSDNASASCTWDTSNEDIICAHGPTPEDSLVVLQRCNPVTGTSSHIASWDAPCPSPDLPCDHILDTRYFPDNSSTCVVFSGGDVVVVRESPLPDQEKIEILGSVDIGIAAASWSPDEELLVILTNAATLLYMSREFESIVDVDLTKDDLKASKHVSVGWGKAETQFRGKGARAVRDPTMPEKVDQGLKSKHDNGNATISWRGDGAYVAVNSLQESDRRVIRIYNREGELDGVTEPVDNLEHALSWRPAGNLMAGVQRFEDRIDIIFFERNGLRHGQFSLRLRAEELDTKANSVELSWNQDSTILAVCLPCSVQLWTMGNYHYYLKQDLVYQQSTDLNYMPSFTWHPENPLLFTIGHRGLVQRSEYGWRVSSGTNVQPHDYGLTGVIDGRILKITPMRLANVPPPMAHVELELPENIVDLAFADILPSGETDIRIAILGVKNITVYQWNMQGKPLPAPKLYTTFSWHDEYRSSGDPTIAYPRQIGFVDRSTVVVVGDNASSSVPSHGSKTIAFNFDQAASTSKHLNGGDHVRELVPTCYANKTALIQWKTGKAYSTILQELSESALTIAPYNSQSITASTILVTGDTGNLPIIFGLQKNGMLYANNRCLAKGCTSFLSTTDHLVFTTSQHLLKFVHMGGAKTVDDLVVPADTPEVDERCRAVERGARLIQVTPSISALVLQMPRGNLETIYPRALVLPVIRNSINAGKYKKAFLACRNHRVDMNIIHDHAPQKFLNSVGIFIDQVKKVESIDLFLSQLREEDVSVTMYKETLPQSKHLVNGDHSTQSTSALAAKTSKINSICLGFLDALETRRSTNLQNIVTAYVCQNPPALEQGLAEIANLQKIAPEQVDRSFDAALGMYDLDMTLLIAQQSQRDPREYLPFLQKLKEKDLLNMKIDIDNHLRRYAKVLQHYHELDDFEALQKHMVRYELYDEAIVIYKYQETRLTEIMKNYAEYLDSKSRHKDAGTAYEYVKDYRRAAESYHLAHLWQEALSCATLIPMGPEELQSFALRMVDSLIELKDYKSAATIQLDYLQNIETAARLLCKGYFFAEASRILGFHKRSDLLETVLDVGLAEGQATITEVLAEMKTQLNAQVPRIRELRIKKVEEPLAFYDGGAVDGADVPDNVSLAGTDASTVGGTLFTRYTNRSGTVATNATRATSKKRMREERKRARGKKGSVYEEEYLINSVARLIERVNSMGEEVERLVVGLMRRCMRERARAVETAMIDVVQICKDYSPEVFVTTTTKEEPEKNQYKPTGGDGVFAESMEEIQTPREAPTIKAFEKLSILGI